MIKAGLYIHFPFCRTKCIYCDFYSVADRDNDIPGFTKALIQEIYDCPINTDSWMFDTVFLGGGTPSLLSVKELEVILAALHKKFNLDRVVEWTMEANPGEVSFDKLQRFREMGINRVSFGVQSLRANLLKFLTRIHSVEDVYTSFNHARNAGFDNINCDMIFNIPEQSLKTWQEDLKNIVGLQPEHISAYSLTIESGTVLKKMVDQKIVPQPDDDEAADMYLWTQSFLETNGYFQYEISNYAKTKPCVHNLHYWQIDPVIAFGPSAHGFDGISRYNNVRSVDTYMNKIEKNESPVEQRYVVSDKEMINDRIGFGLRMAQGIDLTFLPQSYYPNIPENWKNYVIADEKKIKLKKEGFLFADAIAVDMMID